jgi:TfoX/Sxy family transcriptional regulator of competence genes
VYDDELAARIRGLLSDEDAVTEQKMFGGLGFLVNGNMAVAASREGGILVRVDPDAAEPLIAKGAEPMVMRGRAMNGWLRVAIDDVPTKAKLQAWVSRGVTYARSLPSKR